MKSNLVSHCMHLGHWREREKQEVTQHAELGGFLDETAAAADLESVFPLKGCFSF